MGGSISGEGILAEAQGGDSDAVRGVGNGAGAGFESTPASVGFGGAIVLTQALAAARDISAIADTSLTLNDALHCAIAAAAGKETVVGTTYTVKTPSTGTVLRTFTLDSGSAPTSRT